MVPVKTAKEHSWFEWTQLLISLSIPLVVVVYTVVQYNNDISIARQNREQDLQIAKEQRGQDIFLTEDQQQEDTLVNYLNSLAKLLEKNGMRLNKTPEARPIARFLTLSALSQLKSGRKMVILRLLLENSLIRVMNGLTAVINLAEADFSGLEFKTYPDGRLSLSCADMAEAILTNASFSGITLNSVYFDASHLANSDFSSSTGTIALCGSSGVSFFEALLDNSNFDHARYVRSEFDFASLMYARLRNFSCAGCRFFLSQMISTDMSNAQFLLYINQDITTGIIQYTTQTNFTKANMAHAVAVRASFSHCIFHQTILLNISLIESMIINSSFYQANLTLSSWKRAKVIDTNFTEAEMRYVDFSDGQCHHCVFINTDLTGTNFFNTSLTNSDFTQTNVTYSQLAVAHNLDGVIFPWRSV